MSLNIILLTLFVLNVGSWITAYLLIYRQNKRDNFFAFPVIILAGDAAWNFTYSGFALITSNNPLILSIFFNFLFLFVDMLLFKQFFLDFNHNRRKDILLVVCSFLIFMLFFAVFRQVYSDLLGINTGMIYNLVLSISFLHLLLTNTHTKGQTIIIGFFRLLGCIFAGIAIMLVGELSIFLALLIGLCITIDIFYLLILQNKKTVSLNGYT